MSNPWLNVPLGEYEAHMNSAEVQQLKALSDLFAETIRYCRPTSIAILGIAGGNGLEHIDSNLTSRVAGLDVNQIYLEVVKQRYPHLAGLELHRIDLAEELAEWEPFQLVHAALIFEHAGMGRCIENAVSLTAAGGKLSIVLQLPGKIGAAITSPFKSIQALQPHFSLVNSASLRAEIEKHGFRLTRENTRPVAAGKGLWLGIFSTPESRSKPEEAHT